MKRLIMLGLLAALALSACVGVAPSEESADQVSEVSAVVYKSPT